MFVLGELTTKCYNNSYLASNIEFNLTKFSNYLAQSTVMKGDWEKIRKGEERREGWGGGHLPQMPHAGSANEEIPTWTRVCLRKDTRHFDAIDRSVS